MYANMQTNSPDLNQLYDYFSQLQQDRAPFEPAWKDITRYMFGLGGDDTQAGQDRAVPIVNTSAYLARTTLAGAMLAMVLNPGQRNRELLPVDEVMHNRPDVMKLCEHISDRMNAFLLLPEKGFYPKAHEYLMEYVGYGQGVMLAEKVDNKSRFTTCPTMQCYIDVNDWDKVDTVFRTWEWSIYQLKKRFPPDRYPWPPDLKAALEGHGTASAKVRVMHAVFPADCLDISNRKQLKSPFTGVYALADRPHMFHIQGHETFPYFVARFNRLANQKYPEGPGHLALPDVKSVNKLEVLNMETSEMMLHPPMVIPHRGWMSPIKHSPKSVIYRDAMEGDLGPVPFAQVGDGRFGMEYIASREGTIMQHFYVDRLRGPNKKAEMKEMELLQDQEERLRDMAPQTSRLETEWLSPLTEWLLHNFGDELMKGYEGPIPPEFEDGTLNLKIHYTSPVHRAQSSMEAASVNRMVQQFILPLAQVDQTVIQEIDTHEYVKYITDRFNLPRRLLKDADQKAEAQAQAQMQQETQAQSDQMLQASQAIKNISQAQAAAPDGGMQAPVDLGALM